MRNSTQNKQLNEVVKMSTQTQHQPPLTLEQLQLNKDLLRLLWLYKHNNKSIFAAWHSVQEVFGNSNELHSCEILSSTTKFISIYDSL